MTTKSNIEKLLSDKKSIKIIEIIDGILKSPVNELTMADRGYRAAIQDMLSLVETVNEK